MEDDQEEIDTFEYLNQDIKLLALHVLLEGFYRRQTEFTLEQFLKGDYWKIEEISDEIKDTNDYGSVQDLVLQEVQRMVKGFNIGKINRVSVSDLSGLTDKVIRQAVSEKNGTENEVLKYSAYIEEIFKLKSLKEKRLLENGYKRESWNRVDFIEDEFHRYIQYIAEIGSEHIEFELEFNEERIFETNDVISAYLEGFSRDDYQERKPDYRAKRFYFSKQIENFYEYLKRFPTVDGYVNIPFSSLTEDGFEIVKILSYLERHERIKVRNWNDTELWNVKFHKVPITLGSILGQEVEDETAKAPIEAEIKLNLSFSQQTGVLSLIDNSGNETRIRVQGQVQREVLRAIFQNPENTYSEWSLYDISEQLGGADVNETAVKNAIYQFNRKVKLSIPNVDNLFLLTKHSAQIDPKYVQKS